MKLGEKKKDFCSDEVRNNSCFFVYCTLFTVLQTPGMPPFWKNLQMHERKSLFYPVCLSRLFKERSAYTSVLQRIGIGWRVTWSVKHFYICKMFKMFSEQINRCIQISSGLVHNHVRLVNGLIDLFSGVTKPISEPLLIQGHQIVMLYQDPLCPVQSPSRQYESSWQMLGLLCAWHTCSRWSQSVPTSPLVSK